jgi:hypothetical protein
VLLFLKVSRFEVMAISTAYAAVLPIFVYNVPAGLKSRAMQTSNVLWRFDLPSIDFSLAYNCKEEPGSLFITSEVCEGIYDCTNKLIGLHDALVHKT